MIATSVFLFTAALLTLTASAVLGLSTAAQAGTGGNSLLSGLYRRQIRKSEKQAIARELSDAELFIIRMLKSGVYTVQEIIGAAADMTCYLEPYFRRCHSRYYSIGTGAITRMKNELGDHSFAALCDALVYAASFGKREMASQIETHLSHVNQLREYRRMEAISKKESKFTFCMILPMISFLIVQIYPWLLQALERLSLIW